ncbi:MAG: hypothetical protein AUI14_21670 [Actinobacteria bacterium 13_2_20CM_2_71_6]|nr:MAG: hypothetical protein AUI14_21670 [Actinobacteria bacterium 13_2_20CM_2_71_6]
MGAWLRTMVGILVVLAGVALPIATLPAGPARAAPGDQNCANPGPPPEVPAWAQEMLAPQRVWPLSRGATKTVAVLGSGVDAGHPQLRGHVNPGYDATTGSGTGNSDCLGLGTQVAGVIAAQPSAGTKLVGIAPDVTVEPVRVVAQPAIGGDVTVDPVVLVRGINWAVSRHVDVLCVAVALYAADARVAAAVRDAQAQGVVVVAAVGDKGDVAKGGNPNPYPASYPGVIAVSALLPNGSGWPGSGHGFYVTVAAPGSAVLTLQRGQGLTTVDGTGVAAGFVAGSVALLLEGISGGRPDPLPALNPKTPTAAEQEQAQAWADSARLALWLTGAVAVLVVAVLAVGAALPRGRRRRWRPALAKAPPDRTEPQEPGPPILLFDER